MTALIAPFPVRLDITIRQGSIFQLIPLWQVGTSDVDLVPMDLTGYTAKMQIRSQPGASVIAEYTTENARILLPTTSEPTSGTSGVHVFSDTTKEWNIWIRIPATDTANLPSGVYLYDLELEPPANAGARFAFYEGVCRIAEEVTK